MRKVFVITIFGILAAGVVAGGGILLWQFFRSGDGGQEAVQTQEESLAPGGLRPAGQAENTITELPASEADSDGDGLLNVDELLWGVDPNNPDTDGDGYLDGEEVAANHHPGIPAPDDLLPEGFVPGRGAPGSLAAELNSDPARYDHLFVENLNLNISSSNLTDDFRSEFGAEDQSRAAMNEFAERQTIIQTLPDPDDALVPEEGSEDTSARLSQYLGVADNPNVLANVTLYRQAQYNLTVHNNPGSMLALSQLVQTYRESVQGLPVPQSALGVHKLILGYTELLAATLDQIALWPDDPVKSMAATRQLEHIDTTYYPLIAQELGRLRSLQQSLAAGG